jgi:hypothetical protein
MIKAINLLNNINNNCFITQNQFLVDLPRYERHSSNHYGGLA